MTRLLLLLGVFTLMFSFTTQAQYNQFTLQERVTQSDLILEGKVINQFTFKKEDLIYTASQLEVCATIYQKVQPLIETNTDIYVITHGGEFNGEFNTWSHMLNLHVGTEGLFFLRSNTNLTPDNPPNNSSFYEAYGQEQGFVSFSKDNNWDFQGKSLFESIISIDSYINDINQLTSQSSVTKSCIINNKSGLVVRLDTVFSNVNEVVIQTSIKGQLSRNYDLNEAKIEIEFGTPIDLTQYNFTISTNNPSIQNNYILSWLQTNTNLASVETTKNISTNVYQEVNSDFIDFLEIRFHPSLLTVTGLDDIHISQASYKEASQLFDFLDYDIVNNKFLNDFLATPNMTSFAPLEVCAGIKADNSIGNPALSGFVIISGENFGDVAPNDFPNVIPNDYRVEFTREESLGSSSFKVTPLPEDYEYWTDNEIKVRVPTAGWLVNNNNIISNLEKAVAVTGKITVRNPDGSDNNPNDQTEKELTVRFAHFNSLDATGAVSSKSHKLINQSTNGGYYFIFDPSFDNIVSASNLNSAKQDVKDAFCEWNMLTGAKLEIVESCPTGVVCSKITYKLIQAGGSGTVALAAGLTQPTPFSCPEEVVIANMELRFNTEITDWKPSSLPNPSTNDHIIKPTALHEIGHLLQLGHVYNDNATMHPFYSINIAVDNDATAGGTHVSNVSTGTACTNPLVQGQITSCMTPTYEVFNGQILQLFPNPAHNKLELLFETSIEKETIVEIYNLLGELVFSQSIQNLHTTINVAELISGSYFLLVKNNKTSSKLLKFMKI